MKGARHIGMLAAMIAFVGIVAGTLVVHLYTDRCGRGEQCGRSSH